MAATLKTLIEKGEARAKALFENDKSANEFIELLDGKINDLEMKHSGLVTELQGLRDIRDAAYDNDADWLAEAIKAFKDAA